MKGSDDMNIISSDNITPAKRNKTGRHTRIFNSTWFCLLGSLLYMTLPQFIFFLASKSYQYNYGIKNGSFFLIVGLFLWIDTFVISRIEKESFDGLSFCGFIFGIILTSNTVHHSIMLYQYVQTAYL